MADRRVKLFRRCRVRSRPVAGSVDKKIHVQAGQSPDVRRLAVVGLVLLLALVAGGTLALSAVTSESEPANATINEFEPRVAVGNESGGNSTDGVVTCNDRGPMPGNAGLAGRLVIERPFGDDGSRAATLGVVVTVGDELIRENHTVTLEPGESEEVLLFEIVEQPDTLDSGVETSVQARVTTGDNLTVAMAPRTVTVDERDVPCADEGT